MSRLDPNGLLQAFSTLALDLQRLAQHQDIEHFQHHALARLSQLLAFESAWWGRAAVIDGMPEEHNSTCTICHRTTWRTGSRSAIWT